MEKQGMPEKVENDVIVTMKYSLTVDGRVVDTSEESGITEFIQGHGNVIPGLEKNLSGMKIGESKTIRVNPLEGYGEPDTELIIEVEKSEFPADLPFAPGLEIEMEDEDGELLEAVITEVKDDTVILDFNDPLSGKDLEFSVTIVDLRYPTQGELECGCVHCEECHDLDCEDEDCC